jgi:3-dehydroquinate synthase
VSLPAPIEVPVNIPGSACRVLAGNSLLGRTGEFCRQAGLSGKCTLISDENVAKLHAQPVLESLRAAGFDPVVLAVPAGEKSKSLAVAEDLLERMASAGLDRGSFVVALGGGVVGDLAGFVAAIYQRGIPFVQVPTTIVAQVDSSVGGKTGVNLRAGKNLAGAFHQPLLVLADTGTLSTLPDREYREGFAEVIKHGAIRDAAMLEQLDPSAPRDSLTQLIARNIAIKAAVVAEDEKEKSGIRALLNFGHTIGHAVENVAGYGEFLHGEAISLGLAAALVVSERKFKLSSKEADLVRGKLSAFGLPLSLPAQLGTDALLSAAAKDKKFSSGSIRFVVVPRLGDAFVASDVTEDDLREAIEAIRA